MAPEKFYTTRNNGGIAIKEDAREKALFKLEKVYSPGEEHSDGRLYDLGNGMIIIDCLGHGLKLRADNDKDLGKLAEKFNLSLK